ncbi:MAG: hypothetical protein M1816_000507 [Peltula sp. TS41687]|nr:MAG: hypothetical protein M1816_000507 [Peltula sp. TS41687]
MSPRTGFPTLQPAFIMTLDVGESVPIGDIHTGSYVIRWETPTGRIESLEGFEPKINAKIVFGGDYFSYDHDKERGRVNLKGIAKTEEGSTISFNIDGIITVNDEIRNFFGGSSDATTFPFGQSVTINNFEVGDPKYKDLENCAWVGNGRFAMEDGKWTVESRVSKLIPSTDMN